MIKIGNVYITFLHILGFFGIIYGMYIGDDFKTLYGFIILTLGELQGLHEKVDELKKDV